MSDVSSYRLWAGAIGAALAFAFVYPIAAQDSTPVITLANAVTDPSSASPDAPKSPTT